MVMSTRQAPMRTQLEYSGVALEEWVRFSARLLNLCEQILHTSDIPPDQKGFADPRILALALLCRTHGNFRGVILTAKEGLIVEERTLARPCYENMFLVAGLVEKGDAFVAAMYDHEARSVRSRAEFLLDDLDTLNPLAMDVVKQLRSRIQELKKRRPKARLLNPKETVAESVVKPGYLFYSQLSADAAHPSVAALRRHMLTLSEDAWTLSLGHPASALTEAASTLDIACNAVIGVCVGVNQILDHTPANALLNEVFVEYEALSGSVGRFATPVNPKGATLSPRND